MKRIISVMLSLCLTVGAIIMNCAPAALARTSDGFEYEALDDGTVIINRYTGSEKNLKIPEKIDGYTVTQIGWYAFQQRLIESVEIPSTVTRVGKDAFCYTPYFNNEANWDNGILYSGNYLIAADPRIISGKVNVKSNTKVIAENAFCGCENMTEISLPDGLQSIGYATFYGCSSLVSLTIPDSVTHIAKLEIGNGGNIPYNPALKSVVIGKGIAEIPESMFSACENLTDVTIGENVAVIGEEAFAYTGIEKIVIPESVAEIGSKAFYHCNFLSSVELGSRIEIIGSYAFDCENISEARYNGNAENWQFVNVEEYNEPLTDNITFAKNK